MIFDICGYSINSDNILYVTPERKHEASWDDFSVVMIGGTHIKFCTLRDDKYVNYCPREVFMKAYMEALGETE